MNFSEYAYRRQTQDILKESGISFEELENLFAEALDNFYKIMPISEQREIKHLHDELLQEFFPIIPIAANIGKGLLSNFLFNKIMGSSSSPEEEVDPEQEKEIKKAESSGGIFSKIWKAIKIMGMTAFLASLIYIGFRFEQIRSMFPWLAGIIDRIGDPIVNAGKDFIMKSFGKLMNLFPTVASWLINKFSDITGLTDTAEYARKLIQKAQDYISQSKIADLLGINYRPDYNSDYWNKSSSSPIPQDYSADGTLLPSIGKEKIDTISGYPSVRRIDKIVPPPKPSVDWSKYKDLIPNAMDSLKPKPSSSDETKALRDFILSGK